MLGLREEDKTIPLKNLTIETDICWQALLEFLQHTESDELDAYMVDLMAFCNYIKTFADTPTLCNYIRQLAYDSSMTTDKLQKMYFQSMMQVLLEINLKKVLADMLACGDLGESNVKTIMAIFERWVGGVEERFRFCLDLINGILEPSRTDVSNRSRSLVDEYLEKNSDKNHRHEDFFCLDLYEIIQVEDYKGKDDDDLNVPEELPVAVVKRTSGVFASDCITMAALGPDCSPDSPQMTECFKCDERKLRRGELDKNGTAGAGELDRFGRFWQYDQLNRIDIAA
ncbi:condensin, XCAP-G'-subunit [Culex quinquefasciatus]|uniref:Condensin, XCAP-G'-subunit n=1 Tax=Culex quinquefasciatus TaxID=7176 RepID=B0WQ51_CULQU|nr:condensin, XCAP-G'-subunit [Culex quinquefasciatus]|eukprot:XP_001850835.1 condensin, XCAP-G'-subunit [Culex quinquefasciatus]